MENSCSSEHDLQLKKKVYQFSVELTTTDRVPNIFPRCFVEKLHTETLLSANNVNNLSFFRNLAIKHLNLSFVLVIPRRIPFIKIQTCRQNVYPIKANYEWHICWLFAFLLEPHQLGVRHPRTFLESNQFFGTINETVWQYSSASACMYLPTGKLPLGINAQFGVWNWLRGRSYISLALRRML